MQLDIIPLFLTGLRGWQLILVIIVGIIVFGGASKIPGMMRNLGKGVHAFKQGLAEAQDEIRKPVERPADKPADKAVEEPKAKDVN